MNRETTIMAIAYSPALWLPLLLLPLCVFLLNKKWIWKKQNQPPGPPRIPILGNLHQLGQLPHLSLRQLSNKYGSVMLLQLGSKPTLVVSSAAAAEEILKTHDLHCCSRPAFVGPRLFSYNYLDIGFSPYGQHWREIRKICVLQLLSAKRVQSFQFVREEAAQLLIKSIAESSSSSGGPIDLSAELVSFATDVIFRTAFGRRLQRDEFETGGIREAMDNFGGFYAADFFPYFGWIVDRLRGSHGRLERSFHKMDAFYEQVIDHHLDPERVKGENEEDIVDVLLKIKKEQSGEMKLSNDHIKAVLADLLLAGVDTSSSTAGWAMAEMARNPRILKKAQAEVRSAIGNKGRVSESDLEQLLYLKMVVKETLRLHPPGPLLGPREVMSHFQMNGYHILPKTLIFVNVWAIGRDPNFWNNPEEFYPERFTDNSIDFRGQDFELLPFGAGRRACPGSGMGSVVVELAIATLLHHFNWKSPTGIKDEDINMEEETGLAMHKKYPLILHPTPFT